AVAKATATAMKRFMMATSFSSVTGARVGGPPFDTEAECQQGAPEARHFLSSEQHHRRGEGKARPPGGVQGHSGRDRPDQPKLRVGGAYQQIGSGVDVTGGGVAPAQVEPEQRSPGASEQGEALFSAEQPGATAAAGAERVDVRGLACRRQVARARRP